MPQKTLEKDPSIPLPNTDGLPMPVLQVRKDGRLSYANRASRPILNQWDCKVNDPLPAAWIKKVASVLKTGKQQIVEQACGKRLFSIQMSPDRGGRFVSLVGQDITTHKKTEEQLRTLSMHQEAILAAMPEIIMEVNAQKVYTWANPAGLAFFGRDVIGKEADHYFEGEQNTYEVVQPLFNGNKETIYLESWQRRQDGQRRLLAWWCHTLLDKDRKVLGALSTAMDITEQRAMEANLYQAQEHYSTLFKQSPDAIFILDLQGKNMEANDPALAMLGYSLEELQQLCFRDISNELGESNTIHERLIRGEKLPPYERTFRRKDGSLFPVEINVALIYDHDGQPSRIQSIARDISERRRMEQALKMLSETQREFMRLDDPLKVCALIGRVVHELVGDSLVAVSMLDEEKKAMRVVDHFGFGPLYDDLVSKANFDPTRVSFPITKMPAEDLRQFRSGELGKYESGLYGLLTRQVPKRLCQAAEKLLRIQGIYTIGFTRHDIHYGGLILFARQDISPYREMIEALANQAAVIIHRSVMERKLRAAEGKYRILVEQIPAITYIDDPEKTGVSLFVSPQIETILGISQAEWMHYDIDDWGELIHPEDRERVLSAYQQTMETDQPFHEEYRVIRPDGRTVWIDDHAVTLVEATTQLSTLHGVMFDITERKLAETIREEYSSRLEMEVEERTRDLRQTQEKLIRQEKLAVLGQLAGGVGHELRNPLAVINNAVYYLKMIQDQPSAKVQEYLTMIEKETQNAEKIITDLLEFSRNKSVNREPVSAVDLVRQVMLRYPSPEKVRVKQQFASDLPWMLADQHQIEQVLGNLVVNAYQAMPEGGTLSISAKQIGDKLALVVKDTGIGIPPENMDKIFEPLFTTKAKGVGLGLAVSRKLVEANEGRITVQSTAGKGTCFTVLLPVHVVKHE